MALYSLTYDLRTPGRDYATLYKALGNLGAVRVLESTWCFRHIQTSAKNIREYFKQFIDANDGLFVSEIEDWASYNVNRTPSSLS